MEVRVAKNQFIALSMLKEYSVSKDEGRIYKYFKGLVDLGASLNVGRNHFANMQLANIYAFEPVYAVIVDPQAAFDLKSCFIKLLNSMHLDREPLTPLDIPSQTAIMNEIPPFENFTPDADTLTYNIKSSEVEIPPKLLKLKDFILDFLLNEKGVQDLNDKKKNMFVYNLVTTLNFLLNHGFYKD